MDGDKPTRNCMDERKWDHLTPDELYNAVVLIKSSHEPTAARNVIECLYERLRDDVPFDVRVLELLVLHAFARMLEEGRTLDQGFGVKNVRGQYARKDTTIRDLQLAYLVAEKQADGLAVETAINDVEDTTKFGSGIVERAYRKHKDVLAYVTKDALFAESDDK